MRNHIVSITGDTATVRLVINCPCCKSPQVVTVPFAEWHAYVAEGRHIQNAMPSVSAADRELILTGTCSACWDAMFQDNDEVEDGDVP